MHRKTDKQNFYCGYKSVGADEIFDNILTGKKFILERIISKGHSTPENQWLESKKEEWVILLKGKARILFQNGVKVKLNEGDYILIPKNTKHKVIYTSKKPECFWLAIHYKNI
jgi:cupin 2 domain-containing protein